MTTFSSVVVPFFDVILDFFRYEMQIYEFSFSFWDIFLWSTLASIVISFIAGFIYD